VLVGCLIAAIAVVLWLSLLADFTGRGVNETIEHSRQIEDSFRKAKQFVDNFTASNGRRPTNDEFESWASAYPSRPYTPNGMELAYAALDPTVKERYGECPRDGYLIKYWRGEWEEVYVSWADETTLELDPNEFYLFRSRLINNLLLFITAIATSVGAGVAWRRTLGAT